MNDEREPETPDARPTPRMPRDVRSERIGGWFGPAGIVGAVRRRLAVFLAVLLAAVAIAAAAALIAPARYTATAEVVLDTSDGAIARSGPRAGARAGREVQILRSRAMALAVANALRLDGDFLDEGAGLMSRLPGRGAPILHSAGERDRLVVDRLTQNLAAVPVEGTYSLTIDYTAGNPRTAARIANEYAVQYGTGRLAGTDAASPLDRPYARILSRAEPPLEPSSPRRWRIVGAGALIGVMLAAIAAMLAERRFAGVTGGRDIGRKLGLAHLGSVPVLRSVLPGATSPLEAVVAEPMSGFAEAFRGVMMAIRHAGGKGTQVIAISSALPNEGKTTITACLARSAALGGESVVLIDCDSRRRDCTTMFGLAAHRPGLIEVLRDEATLDDALVRDEASGAWILPLTGPPAEISDLLSGPAMAALIEELRRRFKRVLIDTAPILAISSTRAIGAMADLMVLAVRWRATADHAVLTALRLLPEGHVRIGGVVLSQVDMTRQVKLGHGDPTFYYQQYSKYYS